ncbi:MAG: HesB/YadR/YfhF family protein [Nitrospirae bacterium]|nr:MAG: HesB/YadR/YfhF family protein [Nitrospirota bacterium]
MFTISEKAAAKAREVLAEEGKAGWGLRVFGSGGGCCGPSFGLDLEEKAQANDTVFEQNGLQVFVDNDTVEKLNSMQLDYFQDEEQEGFVLTGGEAPSCGSGSAPSCSSGCTSC